MITTYYRCRILTVKLPRRAPHHVIQAPRYTGRTCPRSLHGGLSGVRTLNPPHRRRRTDHWATTPRQNLTDTLTALASQYTLIMLTVKKITVFIAGNSISVITHIRNIFWICLHCVAFWLLLACLYKGWVYSTNLLGSLHHLPRKYSSAFNINITPSIILNICVVLRHVLYMVPFKMSDYPIDQKKCEISFSKWLTFDNVIAMNEFGIECN